MALGAMSKNVEGLPGEISLENNLAMKIRTMTPARYVHPTAEARGTRT